MTKEHISRLNAARFEAAVRPVLNAFVERGHPFSVIDVVRGAKYENGDSVGESTIYAKNPKGDYVHKRLLLDLKAASARSKVRRRSNSAVGEAAGLVDGVSAMGRQLVEQEAQIQELDASLDSLGLRFQRVQEDLYVALVALSHFADGALPDVIRQIRDTEAHIGDVARIVRLKEAGTALGTRCARMRFGRFQQGIDKN